MVFIKLFILLFVFGSSLSIGILISKKYADRVKELKDMKNALNMFETKINFTYESVPEIFEEISQKIPNQIGNIFQNASLQMKTKSAGEAWIEAIEKTESNLNAEDKNVLKNLRKTFRKNRYRRTN